MPHSFTVVVVVDSSAGKGSAGNAGDPTSIPGSGRSAGKGISYPLQHSWASLVAQLVKESSCNMRDLGLIPGLGRCPGEGNSYPLQYSGPENSMDCIVQFSSVAQSCPTLCDPMNCRTPGFLVHHQLLELAQTHVHGVGDAIQPPHWDPTGLGSSSFSVLSFCLFMLFIGFSRQEYWSGLPFPSLVDHVLSELSTMTHLSWVALRSVAQSFIELDKAVIHVISLFSFLWLWFSFCLPSDG